MCKLASSSSRHAHTREPRIDAHKNGLVRLVHRKEKKNYAGSKTLPASIKVVRLVHRKEQKNYAGSKTLPASIKEKETHWPEVP
jgi:hypothetical protein